MNREIRSLLIQYARIGRTISYSQLNEQLQLGYDFNLEFHRSQIGEDLGDVSTYEHLKGRPLLSALVVQQGSNYEGDGFYKLCENLGYGNWETLKQNRTDFDEIQKDRCFDFWNDDIKYKSFKDD